MQRKSFVFAVHTCHYFSLLTDSIYISGRYPIHFHMCLNTSDSKPYIRDNSIHNTFARCVTIHGTHHVKVSKKACPAESIVFVMMLFSLVNMLG